MRAEQGRETIGAMRYIAIPLLAGCSFGMTPLEPKYDPRTIPRCETDAIYPLGDAAASIAFGGLAVAVAVVGHDAEDGTSKWAGVAAAGGVAAFLAIVSGIGFRWNARCDAAKEQWDKRQIEQDTLVQQSKVAPSGFFCSSGGAVDFCVRTKAECVHARDAAMTAVPGLTMCAFVESAWCASERCATTKEACGDACVQAR